MSGSMVNKLSVIAVYGYLLRKNNEKIQYNK